MATSKSNTEEEQLERLLKELTDIYGFGKTPAEEELVDAVKSSGRLSLRLVVLYFFSLFCLLSRYIQIDTINMQQLVCLENLETQSHSNVSTDDFEVRHNKGYIKYYLEETMITNYSTNRPHTRVKRIGTFCDNSQWYHRFLLFNHYGLILSIILVGILADIYGRKPIMCVLCVVGVVGQLLLCLPWDWLVIPSAILLSLVAAANTFVLTTLFLEMCSDKMFYLISIQLYSYYPLTGTITYSTIDLLKNWIHIVVANIITLLAILAMMWFFTESPRWLMFVGNHEAAWKALQQYNKQATRTIFDATSVQSRTQIAKKIFEVLNTPIYRKRLVISYLILGCTSLTPYFISHSFITNYIQIHILVVVVCLQLTFFSITCMFALKYGRKKVTIILAMTLTCFNGIMFVRHPNLRLGYAGLIWVFFEYAIYKSIFVIFRLYNMELFPTAQRCTSIGIVLSSYHTAAIVQLHFQSIFAVHTRLISSMTMLISSLLSVLFICMLPATSDKGLPDTAFESLCTKLTV